MCFDSSLLMRLRMTCRLYVMKYFFFDCSKEVMSYFVTSLILQSRRFIFNFLNQRAQTHPKVVIGTTPVAYQLTDISPFRVRRALCTYSPIVDDVSDQDAEFLPAGNMTSLGDGVNTEGAVRSGDADARCAVSGERLRGVEVGASSAVVCCCVSGHCNVWLVSVIIYAFIHAKHTEGWSMISVK